MDCRITVTMPTGSEVDAYVTTRGEDLVELDVTQVNGRSPSRRTAANIEWWLTHEHWALWDAINDAE